MRVSKREEEIPELPGCFDEKASHLLSSYLKILLRSPVSLTSVKNSHQASVKHVEDVLSPFKQMKLEGDCADIGSGGGVPGIVLAIVFPNTYWTLVEATRKKADQLNRFIDELELHNVSVFCGRAEELAKITPSTFSNVTLRAVARADACLEYAAPLLVKGGKAFLFKGPMWEAECAYAKRAAIVLGMVLEETVLYRLSDGSKRVIVVFSKKEDTPRGFPRRPGFATKYPVGELK